MVGVTGWVGNGENDHIWCDVRRELKVMSCSCTVVRKMTCSYGIGKVVVMLIEAELLKCWRDVGGN